MLFRKSFQTQINGAKDEKPKIMIARYYFIHSRNQIIVP